MRQSRFLLTMLLALAPAAVFPPPATVAQKVAPQAQPTPAVQTLIEQATKEPLEAALATLAGAQKQAGQKRDDLLAVAAAWNARGQAEKNWVATKGFYERAWAILETLAPESLEAARSLNNLGNVARQGDPAGVKRLSQRALAIQEKLAPNSLDMARTLNSLGILAYERGDFATARTLFQRTLTIREKLAPDSVDMAGALYNLGNAANGQSDFVGAKRLYERALTIQEKLTPDSLDVAGIIGNLGKNAYQQGDYATAKSLYQRALTIQEKLAPGSLDMARTLNGLGNVALSQGDLAGAKTLFQRALTIREKLAPDSLDVAKSLHSLGVVAAQQGDLAGAKTLFQRALTIQQELAPDSLDVARSLSNLGNVADLQGDLAGAKAFHLRSLTIKEKLAPDSLAVATSLNNLGALQDETGDTQGALDRLRHALKIIDARAPNSLVAPLVLRQLARLALASGDEAQAKAYLKRSNAIDERVKSLPRAPAASSSQPSATSTAARPETRFLTPAENADVKGDTVEVQVAFLAPIPLARYRLWINGRPFGGDKGFDLPLPDERGRLLEKGVLEKGRILEKGRLLEKGEDRAALAKELPPDVAELVKKPQYAHFQQLRLSVPIEDTDGANVRIAIAAETTGGSVSDRQILRLRNPKAEKNRGALRVLAIGVSAYQNLPKLQFAHRDALDMGDAFHAQAGDGKLYKGADITVVTDAEATLARVQQALDQFTRNVRPGDTLILFLSGHGLKKGDASYFAPVRTDPENLEGTGLPWKDVLAKLQEARKTARSVWVLADCCRAAPGLRRETVATAADLKRGVDEGGNLVICTASSGDTPSYESEDLGHGIFTQAWLEALRGDAPALVYEDVARGRVLTLSGLQFAVDASVRRYARKEGVRQAVEFPRLEGSFSPSQPLFMPVPK